MNRRKTNYGLILVCISLIILLALPGRTIAGRFSLSTFILPVLLTYVIIERKKKTNGVLTKNLWLYSAFVLIFVIVSYFNDDVTQMGDILTLLVNYINCILISLALSRCIESETDIHVIGWIFIVLLCLNILMTLLQMINNSYVWEIWYYLNPEVNEKAQNTLEYLSTVNEQEVGENYCPGLFLSIVSNGYFMATFGLLPLCLAVRERSVIRKIMPLGLFLLSLFTLYLVQERAAMIVFLLCSLIALLRTNSSHKFLSFLFVVFALLLFLYYGPVQDIKLGRFVDISLSSDSRSFLYATGWEYIGNHLFLGGRAGFIEVAGKTSHNFFYNSIIYSGFVGAAFLFVLAYRMCKESVLQIVRLKNSPVSNYQLFFSLASLAYISIGFFHNDSLVTGASTIFIISSLLTIIASHRKPV